jgi:hypothetical protein
VNSFRGPSLILGILGSIATFLISGTFFLVYLVVTLSLGFEKVPTPNNPGPSIGLIILIFYYLSVGVLGSSGSLISSFKPRAGGVILLVSGIALLTTLFPGPTVLSVITLISAGSMALFFSAGLLALIEKRAKRPESVIS